MTQVIKWFSNLRTMNFPIIKLIEIKYKISSLLLENWSSKNKINVYNFFSISLSARVQWYHLIQKTFIYLFSYVHMHVCMYYRSSCTFSPLLWITSNIKWSLTKASLVPSFTLESNGYIASEPKKLHWTHQQVQ